MIARGLSITALLAALAALGATGCTTEAFCFTDCRGQSTGTGTGGPGGAGGTGGTIFTGGTGGECVFDCTTSSSSGTGGSCVETNGGVEICDGADNDCNGKIDDTPGLDPALPQTCGTCDNNCYALADSNWNPATVTCTPSAVPGTPGTCSGTCATDYYDLPPTDGKCEYYCIKTANDDASCNNADDDCDGKIDEDVDLCTSTKDCGSCNTGCFVSHGTPACEHTGPGACDASNTKCKIGACDCAPGDCWWDNDGSYATGCEYPCELTNGGVETCDGLDNDCNGQIDDSIAVVPCQGGLLGICADPVNAGTTQCANGVTSCVGAKVVKPGDVLETCNSKDDDCDGAVDNNATDAGGACGMSNIFPCSFGSKQCVNGALVCVGAVDPAPNEVCNNVDDNCDGAVDNNPTDAVGSCNVPPPAPPGAMSACKAGALACVAGGVQCAGSIVALPGAQDTCGIDGNCDGQLTNQPNLLTDVANCGACGNNCLTGAVHANWGCVGGVCTFQGCQPGYFDNSVPKDNKCEYACVFTSAQEVCNAIDDNCDGQVDENLIVPSSKQVCGVSPAASAPECTSGVTIACQNGSWKCTFPAGVCNPTCAGASETCDTLDNNCNGLLNENVANYGQPCASDDAAPVPGHGACRTTGTFVCNGPNATTCSAVKANCATLPGGCTEVCDGIDNDCDGTIDETFQAKGTNATFFVKPAVTKISNAGTGTWVYSYEASRPNSTAVTAGTGNGYTCNTGPCPGTTPVAPANTPLDKTKACSAPAKIPWFNVTPIEVEQTCQAMGGRVCNVADWQVACTVKPPNAAACTWGYAVNNAACTSSFNANKFCNLGPSFDFDQNAATGDQDGLLPTGSALLKNCWADWTNLVGNGVLTNKIFDITGNLREITKCKADATACTGATECCSGKCVNGTCGCKGNNAACATAADCCSNVCGGGGNCNGGVAGATPAAYPLMGGSFGTAAESGATCTFDFYAVDQNFALYDLGFRCCFSVDPGI